MNVHLVNPSHVSFGVGVITPRWLFVLAAATPADAGDPILVDETLEVIDFSTISSGDVSDCRSRRMSRTSCSSHAGIPQMFMCLS